MKIQEQDFVQFLTIKGKLAKKTIDTYRIRFRIINRWLETNKIELDKYAFEKFLYELREKDLSNSAINTYIQTAKHIEGYCKDRGLPTGFSEGIESMPKTHPEINPLTHDEVEQLFNTHLEYKNRNGVNCDSLDLKYVTLTKFLALTGSRIEEAASLKIKRLDIDNGQAYLVNTKNKQNRYVFFDGEIKFALTELVKGRKDDDLVFTNSKGEHIKNGDFNKDLQLRAKKAGITKRVHAHLLRHSFGTSLYKSSHDVVAVKELMGHKDIKSTMIYVSLDTEYLKKSAQRHPLLRKYIKPIERIKEVKECIQALNLDDDNRLDFSLLEHSGTLKFEVKIK